MHFERSIVIDRSPADVWAFVADPANDPRWCDKVRSVEQVAGDGPGPAARYRVRHAPKPLGAPAELAVEVVEFDPPRGMRTRQEDGDGVFDVRYELTPEGSGTRFTQIDDIEWKIPRLGYPIARMMVNRHLGQQCAALKRVLESGA
ncbi:MAG TPA: SRPBCC family protein [Thermoleophilaceae bacterium]